MLFFSPTIWTGKQAYTNNLIHNNMEKKLLRSKNKMIGGVCAGIAEYFDIDPTLVRVLYAVLTIFSAAFPGLLLYIILLILMPQQMD